MTAIARPPMFVMPTRLPVRPTPPLQNGDRLTRDEFERRWDAMPQVTKAELIEGVVYMPAAAAVSHEFHSSPHVRLSTLFGNYWASTPGLTAGDNGSLRLDLPNMPQPDLYLMVLPTHGGQARVGDGGYVSGAPELVAEIAATSASYDLHDKLEVYRRNGTKEYVVLRTYDFDVDYFTLRDGQYALLASDENGVYRSGVFSGLWLDARALLAGDLAGMLRVLNQGLATAEHAAFVAGPGRRRGEDVREPARCTRCPTWHARPARPAGGRGRRTARRAAGSSAGSRPPAGGGPSSSPSSWPPSRSWAVPAWSSLRRPRRRLKGRRTSSSAASHPHPPMTAVRLTSLSSCAGCAAKVSQPELAELLRSLPQSADANLLVGSATGDDAGVYRIAGRLALVQTVDFFTPIVDDPSDFGRIAAANAISDVYAMGGRPITAMAIVGMPTDKLPPAVINRILRGGAAVAKRAGVSLLGGHTIKLPEPVYGLAVTGLVDPRRTMTNAAARPGDLLVLTKPLGTGITTTGIKRGLASPALARRAVRSMKQLNSAGHPLARLVRAATDVTGFGLLGHLASMCRASGVAAEVDAAAVPVLSPQVLDLIDRDCVPGGSRANVAAAAAVTDWHRTPARLRTLLCDAQTSGGLLLCVPQGRLDAVRRIVRDHGPFPAATVGRIVAGRPRIGVR